MTKNSSRPHFSEPTEIPSEKNAIRFETYRYYVRCFAELIRTQYPNDGDLIEKISTQTKRLQVFKGYDREWVARFLKNSWNTEFILNLNLIEDPELARINNQWLPILTYYAIYSAGEAVAYLLDGNKAGSHRKCLIKLNNFLVKSDVIPWNLMYEGPIGRNSNQHKPINFPTGIEVPHNLARRGVEPIQMVCKCLKAEHKKRVDEEFKKIKKGQGQYKYNLDPGYTSLLNFLYRLRIKSNYEDIDLFLTQAPNNLILQFGKDMAYIGLMTLTLFEMITMKKIGKSDFISIVDKYLQLNPKAINLLKRKNLYP